MKKIKLFLILLLVSLCAINITSTSVKADGKVVFLGGYPAGFTIYQRGAYVVGVCDVIRGEEIFSPAKDAGVRIGDVLLSIDDYCVNNAKDIAESIKDGNEKILKIKRENETIISKIKPEKDNLGEYKLGLFVKEGISGVGTITFFTKNGIAALGHPILSDNNEIIEACGGKVFGCNIIGAIKGVRGRPGELRGVFDDKKIYGHIKSNKTTGVFAEIDDITSLNLKQIEIGCPIMGEAFIYSTIEGDEPQKYSVSIVKVDNLREDRNLVIKVNDKFLLEKTNGIVQGMSGSPIIQNNKLVGAVTHVFVNDPTRGFGISIENMLVD